MIANPKWWVLAGGVGLYLAGLGVLGAFVAERVQLDHEPIAVVNEHQYDEAVRQWRNSILPRGENAPAQREVSAASWSAHIRKLDDALTRGNVGGGAVPARCRTAGGTEYRCARPRPRASIRGETRRGLESCRPVLRCLPLAATVARKGHEFTLNDRFGG